MNVKKILACGMASLVFSGLMVGCGQEEGKEESVNTTTVGEDAADTISSYSALAEASTGSFNEDTVSDIDGSAISTEETLAEEFASSTAPENTNLPNTLIQTGYVIEVEQDDPENSYLVLAEEKDSNAPLLQVNLDSNTLLVSGSTGEILSLSQIDIETPVAAYINSMMTKSLPPQAMGIAVIVDDGGEQANGFAIIGDIKTDAGEINLVSQDGDIIINLDEDTEIGGAVSSFEDIESGMQVLYWSNGVVETYPVQADAYKLIVLG